MRRELYKNRYIFRLVKKSFLFISLSNQSIISIIIDHHRNHERRNVKDIGGNSEIFPISLEDNVLLIFHFLTLSVFPDFGASTANDNRKERRRKMSFPRFSDGAQESTTKHFLSPAGRQVLSPVVFPGCTTSTNHTTPKRESTGEAAGQKGKEGYPGKQPQGKRKFHQGSFLCDLYSDV